MVTALAALAAANVSRVGSPFRTRKKLEKSTPPKARPMGGMITSLTRELMMPVKEAPMITPTAKSTTLPRTANFLNSARRDMSQAFGTAGRLISVGDINKPARDDEIDRGQRQTCRGAQAIGQHIG